MSLLAVALVVVSVIALPHCLPLHRVNPTSAALVWLQALTLRALVAIGAAIFVFVYLPQTAPFEAVSRWCSHAVLPLLAAHLGLSGDPLTHAASILPGLALVASLLWVLFGMVRAALALKRLLREKGRTPGPFGSTILDERGVLVALAGAGRPQILISEGALAAFDRQELTASVAHEDAHLRRRHRPLLILSSLLSSLGRLLPGTDAARGEFVFNLERDADEHAVRKTRDPLALASAICKAAEDAVKPPPASTALGGKSRVGLRLEYLLSGGRRRSMWALERSVCGLAVLMAIMVVSLSASMSAWAAHSALPLAADAHGAPCPE